MSQQTASAWSSILWLVQRDCALRHENIIARLCDTPIGVQLKEAGKIFYQALPEDIRETMFTLDAVVDAQDRV